MLMVKNSLLQEDKAKDQPTRTRSKKYTKTRRKKEESPKKSNPQSTWWKRSSLYQLLCCQNTCYSVILYLALVVFIALFVYAVWKICDLHFAARFHNTNNNIPSNNVSTSLPPSAGNIHRLGGHVTNNLLHSNTNGNSAGNRVSNKHYDSDREEVQPLHKLQFLENKQIFRPANSLPIQSIPKVSWSPYQPYATQSLWPPRDDASTQDVKGDKRYRIPPSPDSFQNRENVFGGSGGNGIEDWRIMRLALLKNRLKLTTGSSYPTENPYWKEWYLSRHESSHSRLDENRDKMGVNVVHDDENVPAENKVTPTYRASQAVKKLTKSAEVAKYSDIYHLNSTLPQPYSKLLEDLFSKIFALKNSITTKKPSQNIRTISKNYLSTIVSALGKSNQITTTKRPFTVSSTSSSNKSITTTKHITTKNVPTTTVKMSTTTATTTKAATTKSSTTLASTTVTKETTVTKAKTTGSTLAAKKKKGNKLKKTRSGHKHPKRRVRKHEQKQKHRKHKKNRTVHVSNKHKHKKHEEDDIEESSSSGSGSGGDHLESGSGASGDDADDDQPTKRIHRKTGGYIGLREKLRKLRHRHEKHRKTNHHRKSKHNHEVTEETGNRRNKIHKNKRKKKHQHSGREHKKGNKKKHSTRHKSSTKGNKIKKKFMNIVQRKLSRMRRKNQIAKRLSKIQRKMRELHNRRKNKRRKLAEQGSKRTFVNNGERQGVKILEGEDEEEDTPKHWRKGHIKVKGCTILKEFDKHHFVGIKESSKNMFVLTECSLKHKHLKSYKCKRTFFKTPGYMGLKREMRRKRKKLLLVVCRRKSVLKNILETDERVKNKEAIVYNNKGWSKRKNDGASKRKKIHLKKSHKKRRRHKDILRRSEINRREKKVHKSKHKISKKQKQRREKKKRHNTERHKKRRKIVEKDEEEDNTEEDASGNASSSGSGEDDDSRNDEEERVERSTTTVTNHRYHHKKHRKRRSKEHHKQSHHKKNSKAHHKHDNHHVVVNKTMEYKGKNKLYSEVVDMMNEMKQEIKNVTSMNMAIYNKNKPFAQGNSTKPTSILSAIVLKSNESSTTSKPVAVISKTKQQNESKTTNSTNVIGPKTLQDMISRLVPAIMKQFEAKPLPIPATSADNKIVTTAKPTLTTTLTTTKPTTTKRTTTVLKTTKQKPTIHVTKRPTFHHTTPHRTPHHSTPRHPSITNHHTTRHKIEPPKTQAPNLALILKGLKALGLAPSHSQIPTENPSNKNVFTKATMPQKLSTALIVKQQHLPPPIPKPLKSRNRFMMNMLCFGDSLTAGYHNHGKAFSPYGNHLKQLIHYSSKIPVSMVIKGIVGEMTHKQMVGRLPEILGNNTAFDWVFILGGTNDILHVKNFADDQEFLSQLESVWQPRITKDILKLHTIAHNSGAHTMLLTIPENSIEQLPEYKILLKMRTKINDALRKYAMQNRDKVALCDIAKTLPRKALTPQQEAIFWDDHLHMTPRGYNRMAEEVFKCIRPYIPYD